MAAVDAINAYVLAHGTILRVYEDSVATGTSDVFLDGRCFMLDLIRLGMVCPQILVSALKAVQYMKHNYTKCDFYILQRNILVSVLGTVAAVVMTPVAYRIADVPTITSALSEVVTMSDHVVELLSAALNASATKNEKDAAMKVAIAAEDAAKSAAHISRTIFGTIDAIERSITLASTAEDAASYAKHEATCAADAEIHAVSAVSAAIYDLLEDMPLDFETLTISPS